MSDLIAGLIGFGIVALGVVAIDQWEEYRYRREIKRMDAQIRQLCRETSELIERLR